MSNQTAERKSKEFWGIDDFHMVRRVTGYECPQEDVWWVPQLGYSMTVGYHLFDSKKDAIEKALSDIDKLINRLMQTRDILFTEPTDE